MPEHEVDMSGPDAPIETVGDHDLVASDRVEGTGVYSPEGEKVGHVRNFMVDKRTGQVAHVIVSDNGFFGLGGDRFVRVPWAELTYDPHLGGYRTNLTKEIMEARGRMSAEEADMQIW